MEPCLCRFLERIERQFAALTGERVVLTRELSHPASTTLQDPPLCLDDDLIDRIFGLESSFCPDSTYQEVFLRYFPQQTRCSRRVATDLDYSTVSAAALALPSEIWALIASHLSSERDICNLRAVCRQLREVLGDVFLNRVGLRLYPMRCSLLTPVRSPFASRTLGGRIWKGCDCIALDPIATSSEWLDLLEHAAADEEWWLHRDSFAGEPMGAGGGGNASPLKASCLARGSSGAVMALSDDGRYLLSSIGTRMSLASPLTHFCGEAGWAAGVDHRNGMVQVWRNEEPVRSRIQLNARLTTVQRSTVRKSICALAAGTRLILMDLERMAVLAGDDAPPRPREDPSQKVKPEQKELEFTSKVYVPAEPPPEEADDDDAAFEIFSDVSLSADSERVASLRYIINSALPSSELKVIQIETGAVISPFQEQLGDKIIGVRFGIRPENLFTFSTAAQLEHYDLRTHHRRPQNVVSLPGLGRGLSYISIDLLDNVGVCAASNGAVALIDFRKMSENGSFTSSPGVSRIAHGVLEAKFCLDRRIAVINGLHELRFF